MDNAEFELRRVMAQADRARAIIEDPVLVAAFTALDIRYVQAWRNSPADRPEMRERLWHHIQALAEVRAELQSVLNDGIQARAALDELRGNGTDTP